MPFQNLKQQKHRWRRFSYFYHFLRSSHVANVLYFVGKLAFAAVCAGNSTHRGVTSRATEGWRNQRKSGGILRSLQTAMKTKHSLGLKCPKILTKYCNLYFNSLLIFRVGFIAPEAYSQLRHPIYTTNTHLGLMCHFQHLKSLLLEFLCKDAWMLLILSFGEFGFSLNTSRLARLNLSSELLISLKRLEIQFNERRILKARLFMQYWQLFGANKLNYFTENYHQ